ncbi:hypothetical protein B0H13DRAFT_1886493 [Mycena leptocephala]|nr:hypothetical protein B0H13DRAFT_1886493 [Mycena leptocephala]
MITRRKMQAQRVSSLVRLAYSGTAPNTERPRVDFEIYTKATTVASCAVADNGEPKALYQLDAEQTGVVLWNAEAVGVGTTVNFEGRGGDTFSPDPPGNLGEFSMIIERENTGLRPEGQADGMTLRFLAGVAEPMVLEPNDVSVLRLTSQGGGGWEEARDGRGGNVVAEGRDVGMRQSRLCPPSRRHARSGWAYRHSLTQRVGGTPQLVKEKDSGTPRVKLTMMMVIPATQAPFSVTGMWAMNT